jgi:hypothetical protein
MQNRCLYHVISRTYKFHATGKSGSYPMYFVTYTNGNAYPNESIHQRKYLCSRVITLSLMLVVYQLYDLPEEEYAIVKQCLHFWKVPNFPKVQPVIFTSIIQ